MIRLIFITLVILIFTQSIHSQEKIFPESIGFHILPIGIIDPYSRIRFGIDYDNGKNLGIVLDYGIGNSSFLTSYTINSDDEKEYYEYAILEIRPEVKLYTSRGKHSSWYFAAEVFFIVKEKIYEDDYYNKENPSGKVYYDFAKFNVNKTGLHIKAGVEMIAGGLIKFDLYWGIGIAAREKYYTDVVLTSNYEENSYDRYSWSTDGYKNEKTSNILHITAGVRIGVILFKGNMND